MRKIGGERLQQLGFLPGGNNRIKDIVLGRGFGFITEAGRETDDTLLRHFRGAGFGFAVASLTASRASWSSSTYLRSRNRDDRGIIALASLDTNHGHGFL